ncbi:glucosaminidase domain-containing protein [Puia sp.]|jgi:LysM repeat protein|uniref:glucosaminidase domain-containing protein n=1 Tax=Puia sp. TaxID=2045100 RepID=UPI002F3E6F07
MHLKSIVTGLLLVAAVKWAPAQMSVNGVVYVNTYKALAMAEMQRSGIPASIILAQGLHETEAGTSELVKQSNNHFGIKCKDDWKGQVVYHDDDARQECFRSYATAADSYRDHSDFLRRSSRYAFLFRLEPTDYEGWAYGLRKAGYATNIKYSQILIKLVKDYNLQQYTLIAMGKMKPSEEVVLTMPGAPTVTPVQADVADGAAGSGDGTTKNKPAAGAGGLNGAPAVSYPEGEFTINRTKVIYAQAGTSLLAIANQYELSLPRLMEFNELKEEDVLVKGQLIFLQRKRRVGSIEFHIVREGESVYDIGQAEGVRLEDLLQLNQLSADSRPAAGERIYLQRSAPSRPRLATGDNKR